ncbi:MAG: nitrate ABC transporter substrate-binding protein, partial [Pseudomonadota bacterium]
RRWGQIAQDKPDSWYHDVAKTVYLPATYLKAARMLVDEGHVAEADFPWETDGYRDPTSAFLDSVTYDGRKPNAYINSLTIGLKDKQRVVGSDVVAD